MHDIICPHCNKAFKVDEAGYADILKQVRDSEFDQHRRVYHVFYFLIRDLSVV